MQFRRCLALPCCLAPLLIAACSSDTESTPSAQTPDAGTDASEASTEEGSAPEGGDAPPEATATEGGNDAPDGNDAASTETDCDRLAKLETALSSAASDAERLSLVDSFQQTVFASDGFPIHCGAKVTFLFRAPAEFGTPHVAGDFNGFDATAAPMTKLAGDAWRATLDVPIGAQRFKYKLTDGTNWTADPLARRFGYDEYGEYSLVTGGATQGHLERLPELGGAGLEARPLTLYLPPGYDSSTGSFPVLYAHDGQNLFDPDAMWGSWKLDTSIETELNAGNIEPMIVVGIHNTSARMDEYTPVDDLYNGQTVGGKADAYYELIKNTIMPDIAKRYRVKTDAANTWTMGSSLGGLVSLYFGVKHPETFGRVAGLSSTLGWGSMDPSKHNPTLMQLLPTLSKPAVVFYLDSGGGPGSAGCADSDNDGVNDDDLEADDNYCETIQMRDVFEAQGYEYDKNLFHWWEQDAEHNEAAWAARVFRPLRALAGTTP